jgi:hypothetical protein
VTLSSTPSSQTFGYTVTDHNGCTSPTSVTITQPATALSATSSATTVACNGGTAIVTVSASGGTPGYNAGGGTLTFNATGSATFTVTLTPTPSSQTFSYTVTDAKGCTSPTSVTITQPATALSATSSATTVACNGGTAIVTVSASGGTPGYNAGGGTPTFNATGSATFTVTLTPTPSSQTFSYTVTDAKGCTAPTSITITQPALPLSATSSATTVACNGGTATVTVTPSGGTAPYNIGSGTFKTSTTFTVTVSGTSQTFTYTVTDANKCTAATTVSITQPTALSCGSISGSSDVQSGSGGNTLTADPSGGTPQYSFKWTVNNPAWIIADTTANPVSYTAPAADSTAIFTNIVTDANGCVSKCTITVTSLPLSFVTDSMLCTFNSPPLPRLIFTQDPTNMPCYKLTASNPGQYYLNMTYQAQANLTPPPAYPTNATFNITVPYPFVTQGAQPIHGYDGVTIYQSGGQTCLTPGNVIFVTNTPITLTNYGPSPIVGVTTCTLTSTVPLSASGYVYLNIHLDYGLKKVGGYQSDGAGNATNCTYSASQSAVTISNNVIYPFSYAVNSGSAIIPTPVIQSGNDFKKNPGVGGLVVHNASLNAAPGATAVLKDSNKNVLGTSVTDSDGWYMVTYKWTGKATTLYVTLTPAGGGTPITQTVTLKSNGYAESDFTVP